MAARLVDGLRNARGGVVNVAGCFDDRSPQRWPGQRDLRCLGSLAALPDYLRAHPCDLVYITLPLMNQPRITLLLDTIRDTTASVYFVPDLNPAELIQPRLDTIAGQPVLALCETPFQGFNGLVKRTSDIVLALTILMLIAPLLGVIALAIRMESPGPAVFRQRRYGLDGREIVVYKFRSMRVCEDGDTIHQAKRGDHRLTRLGALLRRTSLDELPQFINVLQGRMSVVGPRPHAVAHNEHYRQLIKGYMLRHKVRPGITGWAQVNGHRGETDTLEKMQARLDYDLAYLRHWSLGLDLRIILRTVRVVLGSDNAY